MLLGIVRDASLGRQKHARKFRSKLLVCFLLRTEHIGAGLRKPVQPIGVPGPMAELVQRSAIVFGLCGKRRFRRQVDRVRETAVEGAVLLVMMDLRAGVLEDRFAGLYDFPLRVKLRLILSDALNLSTVEDCVDTMDQSATLVVRARRFIWRILGLAATSFVIRELPELDLRAFFAFADLPTLLLRLEIGHPARVFVAPLETYGQQVNRVTAAICLLGGGIVGQFEGCLRRVPRFLPRSDALFEHRNNVVGDLLAEVAFQSRGSSDGSF